MHLVSILVQRGLALLELLTSREVGLRVHHGPAKAAGIIDTDHDGLGIQRPLGESSNAR